MFIDPIKGRYTLVDLDGALCVLYEVPLTNEPKIMRLWWPTGQRTQDVINTYGNLLGVCLERAGLSEHGYRIVRHSSVSGTYMTVHLQDRGRTEAIKKEEVDAPQPRPARVRGKRVFWRDGQWWREMASGPQAMGVEL